MNEFCLNSLELDFKRSARIHVRIHTIAPLAAPIGAVFRFLQVTFGRLPRHRASSECDFRDDSLITFQPLRRASNEYPPGPIKASEPERKNASPYKKNHSSRQFSIPAR